MNMLPTKRYETAENKKWRRTLNGKNLMAWKLVEQTIHYNNVVTKSKLRKEVNIEVCLSALANIVEAQLEKDDR